MIISMAASSQVTKVLLKASGLTCSMCSNAINKALKTLDFVEAVDANIKTYTFQISFKPNSNIDFDKIRKKVEGAGFFVADFVACVNFKNVQLQDSKQLILDNNTFLFFNTKEQALNGIREVRIMNKGFTASKEYSFPASSRGVYHATI